MVKDVLQKYNEQYLSEVIAFWYRDINELEMKNPRSVTPEMRAALADTQVCHDDLESVGC